MTNAKMVRMGGVIALCILALYFLSPIITPFFLGALLAYLGDPFVNYLKSKRVPRTVGVMIVFLLAIVLLTAAIFLLVPMIEEQITYAVQKIPDALEWAQKSLLPWVNSHMHTEDYLNVATIKKQLAQHSDKAKSVAGTIITTATHSTLAMIDFAMNCILVPVVAFYLMRDWPGILNNIQRYLPASSRNKIVSITKECDEVIGAFFRGQLLVMLALGVLYSIGLGIIGLKVAIFIGVISGLLTIVPYLGFVIGIIAASIAMYFQAHDMTQVFYVWIVYGIGQTLENMVLTPWLVGDKLGLHPVAVIFAILAGGTLFGFLGVLLALPVAAMILVVLKRTIPHATRA